MTAPRTTTTLALLLSLATACGGDDDGGTSIDAAAPAADARADATPAIDAEPGIDATPAALACLGDALPSTAADPVTVSGETLGLDGFSLAGVAGVTITAFEDDGSPPGVQLGAPVTSAGDGSYQITAATGGDPLDAYLQGALSNPGDPYWPSYLFPPYPVTADLSGGLLPMFTDSQVGNLAVLAGVTIDAGTAIMIVAVVDCAGDAVEGAVVDAVGGGEVIYLAPNGFPDSNRTATSSRGAAVIFNVTPGAVTAGASVGGVALRDNGVFALADAFTATAILP